MSAWTIRPMRLDDAVAAERLSDESFHELDLRTTPSSLPAPRRREDAWREAWVRRTEHLVRTDPGGCWVAEDDDGMVGFATSYRRELMWCLVTYAVAPGRQAAGVGRPLLEAALGHSVGCLRGMIASSVDPRAARRYHQAGFTLHPQMVLSGLVDRSAVPHDAWDKVREGTPGDRDLLDSLDRRTRGAAHGDLHDVLAASYRLLVSDTTTGSGYAYVAPTGSPVLVAASNRRTAARLTWAALADAPGEVELAHVTGANDWAVDVGMAARLELRQSGYLALRGMKPPVPYVHSGALL
ncbi:GNAT family N-acetyltransferase [Nocardioides flavescens]|uniref:GNAT family N-acetyltransferase n=1 Tax=Nocardioides flavescens TaxID=2691959 RepID=UPI00301D1AC6